MRNEGLSCHMPEIYSLTTSVGLVFRENAEFFTSHRLQFLKLFAATDFRTHLDRDTDLQLFLSVIHFHLQFLCYFPWRIKLPLLFNQQNHVVTEYKNMEINMLTSAAKDGSVEYYKNLALEYKRKLDETQQELEEFQESSRDLEAELETQLEQLESQNKELRSENCHLQTECEKLQNKLECSQMEFYQVISSLQDELNKTKLLKEDLHRYVRMLEQKNDDLERATRASLTTLEDFEGRLNQAIERNVFLENELDDKENMTVVVQRLKDETRDLKQELLVHDSLNLQGCQSPRKFQDVVDSNKFVTCEEILPCIPPQRSFTHPNFISKSSSMMPNSALNIVSDLLRKVGVLESKLQSCRNCVKDNSSPFLGKNLTTPLASPKKVLHINGSPISNTKERVPFSA